MEKQNLNLSFDNDLHSISRIFNLNIDFNSQSNLQPQIKKEYLTPDVSPQTAKKSQSNEKHTTPDQIKKEMMKVDEKVMERMSPVIDKILYLLMMKFYHDKEEKLKIKNINREKLMNSAYNELLKSLNPKKYVKKFVRENFIKIPKKHDNMSFDNIMRRIKNLITNSFLTFINKKIKEIYRDSNIKLEKIEKFNNENTNIKFNREFFAKPIKDILSEKITSRCSTKNKDYNKKMINKLLKEENEEKKNIFVKSLNLKVIDLVKKKKV